MCCLLIHPFEKRGDGGGSLDFIRTLSHHWKLLVVLKTPLELQNQHMLLLSCYLAVLKSALFSSFFFNGDKKKGTIESARNYDSGCASAVTVGAVLIVQKCQ